MNLQGKRLISFILCLLMMASSAEAASRKTTVIPLWSPQAQFAGLYVAYEKGFYKRRGIDLLILQGGPGHDPVEYLKNKKADFVVMWLTQAIKARAQGLKLVNICQLVQRSGLILMGKKSDGIFSVEDLQGKKVSYWQGNLALQPEAFFKKYGLEVEAVPQSYTVNLFLRGGVDAATAMWYNEYFTVLDSGVDEEDLTIFFFADHGLNFPEDGIYMLEEQFNGNADLAEDFVEASLEGWEYAFAHPEEALDIILRYMHKAKVPANRVRQKWMLAHMKDLMAAPGGGKACRLDQVEYNKVAEELKRSGEIDSIPAYGTFAKGRCR